MPGPHVRHKLFSALDLQTTIWAAFWLVFAAVVVALMGLRWDESFEHAQILAGTIPYPPDHPLPRYLNSAFTAQTWASVWLLRVSDSAAVVCAVRNILFLYATCLPVFLLARAVSGKSAWGVAAVAIVLSGALLDFDGSYPLAVWPHLFSNGHIGMGYCLVAVWALAMSRWRLGAFLVALMPLVHLGYFPPVLLFAAVLAALALRNGELVTLARAVPWAMAGLACCAVFWLALQFRGHDDTVPELTAQAHAIWANYTASYDGHRQAPPMNAHIVLAVTSLLSIVVLSARKDPARAAIQDSLAIFGLVVPLIVWSFLFLHLLLGADTPFLIIGWMPYRIVNLAPFIALTLGLGLLATAPLREDHAAGTKLLVPLLALLLIALSGVVGSAAPSLQERYFKPAAFMLMLVCGAAIGAAIRGKALQHRVPLLIVGGALVLVIAIYHQFAAAVLLAGAAAAFLYPMKAGIPHRASVVYGLASIILVIGVYHQWKLRDTLPVPAFRTSVAGYLREQNVDPRAMIATEPYAILVQAHTGHPVLTESATASLMSYVPALAPSINAIYNDWYGIDFTEARGQGKAWTELWESRTAAEWQELAGNYPVRYLLIPREVNLPLAVALEDAEMRLYELPTPNK